MKLIQSLAKSGLKFKKERKEKLDMTSSNSKTPEEAAKKRWWQKWNLGADAGSNKKGVSKKKY